MPFYPVEGYTPDDTSGLIAALEESIELLQEENSRYRRSNMLLRRINSDLRRLKNIQARNDEEFKSMCQESFDELIGSNTGAGLASAVETVEPLAID
jgi:hypothetical protein